MAKRVRDLEEVRRHTTPQQGDNFAANANLTNANWDGAGSAEWIDLESGDTVAVPTTILVSSDVDIYIGLNNSASVWAGANGVTLFTGQTHVIGCSGRRYLHFKGVSATGKIEITVDGD